MSVSKTNPGLLRLVVACLLAFATVGTVAADEWVLSRETCSGLFLIPLTWSSESGESHELLAVFDTGGSATAIDPDALERASGRRIAEGKKVRLEGVTAGEARFSTFRPRVRDLDPLSRALGRELDVFLPFDTFDDFLLTLDYPRGELRISRGELPRPDGVAVFDADGPDRRPWLEVRIGGRKRTLLIDSGSAGTLSIRPRGELRWHGPLLPVRVSQRWDRVVRERVGRLDETVALGPLTLERPVVTLTEDTELIGARVLEPLVVTFDQKRRRVRMQAASREPVRLPSYRGTGAILWFDEEALAVKEVLPGTPAEEAGVRAGDRLVAIDGTLVYERGCYPRGGPRAAEQRWTVRRGEETVEVTVGVVDLVP